jgi:hypothetical protein
MAETLHSASTGAASSRGTSLVKVGGALAIAGTIIGMFIFLLACFGFGAAFALALIPSLLGVLALVLVLIGGFFQKHVGVEDTGALAALLLSIAVIAGGLLEVAMWMNKPIFASAGGL